MKQNSIKDAFYNELQLGKNLLKENKFSKAFYHFENAHILGQKHLYRHTASHFWLLFWAIRNQSIKETLGQIFRILASVLFTLIWVPTGNTGGANVSAVQPMPIRKELQKYF